ncbi:helix-hairpin-helix domain-containing protein [Glycomyces sp. TRM65418]|uniref:helix-hairpin-helix domain-containing protein n=1 Tax=Glycomyces sp. TRM65418 TaxID=2867006 RepID=UPI001CE55DAA|nr:helix-hairpin-helix domain-containing protein [Glycomyces sp. TRM65418]MCC3765822.1 helix-hairpin-helix domain-containing protein [Glycomyces sp. TRM65418]QZD55408.1 helix-hairpin-helix domain-containing protein [Glycomyces sp. TRM65418]
MERELPPDAAALAAKLRLRLDQPADDPGVCRETVDADTGEPRPEPVLSPPPVRRFDERLERLQNRFGLSHLNRRVLVAVALLVAAVGLSVTLWSWPDAEPAATAPAAVPEAAATETATIVVSVAGAVNDPGIVELDAGSRVADAIEAAGGLAEGADPGFLNLARVVADGDLVAVPDASAAAPAPGGGSDGLESGGLVNVNVASAAELDALNGIGPVLAERIIEYREANGSFQSLDELSEVSGIGSALLEQLREQVTL